MKEIIKKKMEVGIFAVEVHVSYVLQQCGGTGPGKMNNKVVKCLCNLCTLIQSILHMPVLFSKISLLIYL